MGTATIAGRGKIDFMVMLPRWYQVPVVVPVDLDLTIDNTSSLAKDHTPRARTMYLTAGLELQLTSFPFSSQ